MSNDVVAIAVRKTCACPTLVDAAEHDWTISMLSVMKKRTLFR